MRPKKPPRWRSRRRDSTQEGTIAGAAQRVRSEGIATMTETLTHADIRGLLLAFSAAIKRDQRCVDALPAANFHPLYDDKLWRDWRADHVSYIDKLLSSLKTIPPAMLKELTETATAYEPEIIGPMPAG